MPRTQAQSPEKKTNNTSAIHERLYKEYESISKNKNQIFNPQLKEQEEVSSVCTFKPQTNRKDDDKVRTQAEFVNYMKAFEEQKKAKINKLCEKVIKHEQDQINSSRFTKSPIRSGYKSARSNNQVESKVNSPKRVQEINESKRNNNDTKNSNFTFQPKIDKKSQKLISNKESWQGAVDHLVQDASNRIKKIKMQKANYMTQSQSPHAIKSSNKLILQKLQQEFTLATNETLKGEQLGDLSYDQFIEVIKSMGYLHKMSNNIQLQCRQIWNIIQYNEEQAKKESLFNFLCYLHQVQVVQRSQGLEDEQVINVKEIGGLRNKVFYIEDSKQYRQMFITFYELIQNKNTYQTSEKSGKEKTMKQDQSLSHSGKPQLDEKSMIMVMKKGLDQKSNLDYLKDLSQTRAVFQDKVENLKVQKAKDETLGCTFIPQINTKILKPDRSVSPPPLFQGLKSLSKPRPKQRDRSFQDIEFEQQQDHCTFKPTKDKKILLFHGGLGKKRPGTQLKQYADDNEDLVFTDQMHLINPNQSRINEIMEEAQGKVAIFCLDIKISSTQSKQLYIYENENVESVVSKFAKQHNLTTSKRQKLIAILKEQSKQYYSQLNKNKIQ